MNSSGSAMSWCPAESGPDDGLPARRASSSGTGGCRPRSRRAPAGRCSPPAGTRSPWLGDLHRTRVEARQAPQGGRGLPRRRRAGAGRPTAARTRCSHVGTEPGMRYTLRATRSQVPRRRRAPIWFEFISWASACSREMRPCCCSASRRMVSMAIHDAERVRHPPDLAALTCVYDRQCSQNQGFRPSVGSRSTRGASSGPCRRRPRRRPGSRTGCPRRPQ